MRASRPGFGLEFSPIYRTIFLYYLILALALLTAAMTMRLRRLPLGRAWEALREDEIACRALGINTTSTKLTAFAIGAMFAGFAGSFFAARQGFISPESFTFMESAVIVAIVVLGGMGSLVGVAIAAVIMIGGTEIMRELDFLKVVFGRDFDPTQYRMLLFGFAMVLIMIWKPRGLIGTREPSVFLKERKTVAARLVRGGARMSDPAPIAARRASDHALRRTGRGQRPVLPAARGDITALIGPNGAGKTTVFNCITGFYKPTEGRIALQLGDPPLWDELDALTAQRQRSVDKRHGTLFLLERMPDHLVAQKARVARTFQNIRLFPGMTVLENLLVAQHNKLMRRIRLHACSARSGFPPIARAERAAIDKARYWLEQDRLIERADDPAGDLPYGAQRRLEIARAMCTDPVLLCLDEPAAGLNPRESAELNALLSRSAREHATSMLLIEHDMSVVMEISDHIVVLDHGVKIADGSAAGRAQRSEGDRRLSRRRGRRGREGRSGGRA